MSQVDDGTLSKCAGMVSGKPMPTWSWMWWGTQREIRKASTGISAAKGRWGKAGLAAAVTWWYRTWKRPSYTTLFSPQCTGEICPQESQAPETCGKVWSSEDLPLVEEDQISKHFNKWDIHTCMAPNGEALTRAEGAAPCHGEATLVDLWEITVIWDVQSTECCLFRL